MNHQPCVLSISWQPLPAELRGVEERLAEALESWRDTPYAPGGQQKGPQGGVDCVRFVCGVLDELYGFRRSAVPELPNDVAMHSHKTAISAMRFLRRLYAPNSEVLDGRLEPGDIVVAAMLGAGPGHALIVGARPNTIWHATGRRVQVAGVGMFQAGYSDWRYVTAYRPMDKHLWARPAAAAGEERR